MAKGERNTGWSGFFLIFAVFSAIVLLLAQRGQGLVDASSGTWQVLSVYEGLTSWAIPALFMVWGMSALGDGKPAFRSVMVGLVLPAFCMLVFWGALYAVVGHLLAGGVLSLAGVWAALKAAAMGNTYFHLWILYPLIGLYLVHPVVHRFTASASRGELRYFLALCFLFAAALPMWSAFHPNGVITLLLERLRIHMVLGWVGYYVAGWYLRHYTIGRIPEYLLYALGIAGLILTVMGNQLIGGGRELWHLYTSPNVALTAVAMCTLFRYVLGISEERSRRRSVYQLGSYGVGVYLFHQVWALIFQKFGITILSFTPVVSIPVLAAVFFLLSVPFVWLLSLIPGAGRWLT